MLTSINKKLLWFILLLLLIVRLICNAVVPLADTTEARYAEIARKMVETGNWITPQHDYGVPFWAKPPLSTWLSALSIKLFGANEFATRLPSLIVSIALLVLVWRWVEARRGRDFALMTTAVLASMGLFFIASGAVMTDASLAFCTTLGMIAFWQALHSSARYWGYLFFASLGLGLLAKGPLVGVLTFLPILPWIALRKNWLQVWRVLPWFRGSALMLAIAAPWYAIAEYKTPGFLAYFFIGEHIDRFLDSGWNGDKYGHAHAQPFGMIWAFWLLSALPWSFVLLAKAPTLIQRWRQWNDDDDGFIGYLLFWSLMTMVLFTFADNMIWTYTLPALPAFAILLVEIFRRLDSKPVRAPILALTLFTPIILLGLAEAYTGNRYQLVKPSQKQTAEYYLKARSSDNDGLYYYRRRYYSAEFYSEGRAREIEAADVGTLLANSTEDFLVIKKKELAKMMPNVRAHFAPVDEFGYFVVLKEMPLKNVALSNACAEKNGQLCSRQQHN